MLFEDVLPLSSLVFSVPTKPYPLFRGPGFRDEVFSHVLRAINQSTGGIR